LERIKKTHQGNIKRYKAIATGGLSTTPVFDIDLELEVLAAIAFNRKIQYKINKLNDDDFYSTANKEIYKHFKHVFNNKKIIDIITIGKKINCVSLLNREYAVYPSQIDLQIEKLRELSVKRLLQNIAYKMTVMIDEGKSLEDIKNFYNEKMRRISLGFNDDITTEKIDEELEEYLTRRELPVIKTGFPKLDRITGGFTNGSYTIIASAQGIGKTTLMINFLSHICSKLNKKVLCVSLEMSFLSLQAKIISNLSGVSFSKMMFAMSDLNEEEWIKINEARAKMSNFRIQWLGQKEVSINEIKTKLNEEGDVDIVMIDYMQLLTPSIRGRTLYETMTNISRELKILASEFNIPFVVIASINRDYSDRSGYTPHISDIRGSGSIEYDADLVV